MLTRTLQFACLAPAVVIAPPPLRASIPRGAMLRAPNPPASNAAMGGLLPRRALTAQSTVLVRTRLGFGMAQADVAHGSSAQCMAAARSDPDKHNGCQGAPAVCKHASAMATIQTRVPELHACPSCRPYRPRNRVHRTMRPARCGALHLSAACRGACCVCLCVGCVRACGCVSVCVCARVTSASYSMCCNALQPSHPWCLIMITTTTSSAMPLIALACERLTVHAMPPLPQHTALPPDTRLVDDSSCMLAVLAPRKLNGRAPATSKKPNIILVALDDWVRAGCGRWAEACPPARMAWRWGAMAMHHHMAMPCARMP